MRSRILPCALLSLATCLAIAAGAAHAQDLVRGSIEQVNTADSTIVIRTEGGTRSGRLTPATVITIGGTPGNVRDLRPGQRVTAQFAVTPRGAPRPEIVRLEIALRLPGGS